MSVSNPEGLFWECRVNGNTMAYSLGIPVRFGAVPEFRVYSSIGRVRGPKSRHVGVKSGRAIERIAHGGITEIDIFDFRFVK